MDIRLLIISFVQGIGELLPISSSVNMFFAKYIFNMEFFNFSFKIALHVGSLIALLFYFRNDILDIFKGIFSSSKKLRDTYFYPLFIGTIPVVFFGYFSRDFVKEFQDTNIMGILCIIFGILLWIVDRSACSRLRRMDRNRFISLYKSLWIGIFQTIAVFPGVSRLGITLTASRLFSIDRKKSIHFSMFLAIPSIMGSLVLELYECYTTNQYNVLFSNNSLIGLFLTSIISIIFIYPCIHFMERKGFFILMIYRCIIGFALLKIDFIMSLFNK